MDFNFLASKFKSKSILCLTAGFFAPIFIAHANQQAATSIPPVPAPEAPTTTGSATDTQVRKADGMTFENKVESLAQAASSSNATQPSTKAAETTTTSTQGNSSSNVTASGASQTPNVPTDNSTSTTPAQTTAPTQGEATNTTNSAPEANKSNSPSATLPNGAAIQAPLLPLGQSDAYPWSTLAAGAFLILGIAATGVMFIKLKQGRTFRAGKSERQLQLVTSMALSPKRQIMLVRIRDKEVALASTEHGITLLTELPAAQKSSLSLLDDGGNEEPRRRKVQQRSEQDEHVKLVAASERGDDSVGNETAIARSEMLVGALKNLRERNLRNKASIADESPKTTQVRTAPPTSDIESTRINPLDSERPKTQSTMKQTRAAFPKYLANAFEQESKRTLNQNQNQNQSQAQGQSNQGQDDAGSVTSMIRERLKDLRPLS